MLVTLGGRMGQKERKKKKEKGKKVRGRKGKANMARLSKFTGSNFKIATFKRSSKVAFSKRV
mgnify:CR=1 FL=1